MIELIYLSLTGLSVGLMSSFFGIGGGALMIPMLITLFPNLPIQSLVPISLGVIVLNTSLNIYHFQKLQLLPSGKIIVSIFLGCTLGAFIGSYVLNSVDGNSIKTFIAIMLFIIAAKTLFGGKKEQNTNPKLYSIFFFLTGVSGSLLSSITGLGGGIIYLPIFLGIIKLPLKLVSPYSNVAMLFAAGLSLLPHFNINFNPTAHGLSKLHSSFYTGQVNLLFILVIFCGAFLTSKLGTRLNDTVSFNTKKYLLSALLIIFGIKTLL